MAKFRNVTNTQIHNHSSLTLNPLETCVLSLGLKFIPQPFCNPSDLHTMLDTTIHKLERTLTLALHFDGKPYTPSVIPRIDDNPNLWTPKPNPLYHDYLQLYLNQIRTRSIAALNIAKLNYSVIDSTIHKTLQHLGKNPDIIIKPADKNLGIVILNTSDYITMCTDHLNDTNVYVPVTNYNTNLSYAKLRKILTTYNKLYSSFKTLRTPKELTPLAKSLLQLQNSTTLRVPPFYCLPKIHKGKNPIPGRPICSSLSSVTYHCSLYLDSKLRPLLHRLPTICHSSRQVVNELSNMIIPFDDVILCADVSNLYPSIPTLEGIAAVRSVCIEYNYLIDELDFILALLHWVLTNNYCIFNNNIYLQVRGTAMGTPVAVTYANIFLYHLEMPILRRLQRTLPSLYYRRYVDDIFAIMPTILAHVFVEAFHSPYPTIRLDAVTTMPHGVFLDVEYTLYLHDDLKQRISHKLYQKPINAYQYIPPLSAHKPHVFRNLVLQELKRYRLLCTDNDDFLHVSSLFAQRLTARGYPSHIYSHALTMLPSRMSLLEDLKKSFDPLSVPSTRNNKLVCTLPFPFLHPNPAWKQIFDTDPILTGIPRFRKIFSDPSITLGHKSFPKASYYLTRSKFG